MPNLRTVQRILVAVLGGTVLLAGVALIVLPGPALIVIPAGLALLAMEFAWAKRWLRRARTLVGSQRSSNDGTLPDSPRPVRRRPIAALARRWLRKRRFRLRTSRPRPGNA